MAIPNVPVDLNMHEEGDFVVVRTQAGYALYWSTEHATISSACEGECANLWPPVRAAAGAKAVGEWKPMQRRDGQSQWTFQGKPMHTYSRDTPGGRAGSRLTKEWQMLRFPRG